MVGIPTNQTTGENMTKLEIQAKLEVARAAAKAAVSDKIEIARMSAELALLTSDGYNTARAVASIRESNAAKLAELNTACETIVSSMPIYNSKTRDNRKWSPSGLYGFGSEVGKLVSLLSGIQYSAAEHKAQMLAYTGLTESAIEAALEAVGGLPYYSNNYCTVVEGTPMDVTAAKQSLELLALDLGLTLDTSKLTESNATYQRAIALAKAEKTAAEIASALAIGTVAI